MYFCTIDNAHVKLIFPMYFPSDRHGHGRINTRSDDVARIARSGSGRKPRSVRLQKLSNLLEHCRGVGFIS